MMLIEVKHYDHIKQEALQDRRLKRRKRLQFLPNVFTLGNAFFGFASIIYTLDGDLIAAAYFILLAALFDLVDGRIARFVGATSEFGMQLDSLCDAISFCMAPTLLMYQWQLYKISFLGFFAGAFFLLAGLFRLAKFNVTQQQQGTFFIGVPTPIAGCFLVVLFLNAQTGFLLKESLLLLTFFAMTMLSALMVSSFRFPAFKKINKNVLTVLPFVLVACAIVMSLLKFLFILFVAYFFFGFCMYACNAFKR